MDMNGALPADDVMTGNVQSDISGGEAFEIAAVLLRAGQFRSRISAAKSSPGSCSIHSPRCVGHG